MKLKWSLPYEAVLIFLTVVSGMAFLSTVAAAQVKTKTEIVIPVKFFIQQGSLWTEEIAFQNLEKANKYFSENCNVSLVLVSQRIGNIPGLLTFSSWREDYRFANLNPNHEGIFIIFTGQELEVNVTGYAWSQSSPGRHSEIVNTIFMFNHAISWAPAHLPNFDVLTHELGHILLDQSHNFIPRNFMSRYYNGMDITEKQCEKIRINWR